MSSYNTGLGDMSTVKLIGIIVKKWDFLAHNPFKNPIRMGTLKSNKEHSFNIEYLEELVNRDIAEVSSNHNGFFYVIIKKDQEEYFKSLIELMKI